MTSKASHSRFADLVEARRGALDPAARASFDAEAARLGAMLRLGILVRDVREQRGLTQTELASRIGIAQSALSRIEAGRHNISVEMLARIAAALDLPLGVHLGQTATELTSA